jgi:hypothetical protein
MTNIIGRVLLLSMSVTFFLLAAQAETVTGVFGYIFGSLLFLAVLISFKTPKNL